METMELFGLYLADPRTVQLIERMEEKLRRKTRRELIEYAEKVAPGQFDFRYATKSEIIAELIGLTFEGRA